MKKSGHDPDFFCFYFSFVSMFADNYLLKNLNKRLIQEEPDPKTGIIVVIPCLREPDILQTFDSLVRCQAPQTNVEVLVLVNQSETADMATKEYNQNSVTEIQNWIRNKQVKGISFYVIGPIELRKKWAGAGLARKQGMDEALRRFNSLGKNNGIIVSLDADTLVEPNYLTEIESHFNEHPKNVGATIRFEHQKENLAEKQLEGIQLYEQYLTYYKNALQFTGYPHALFTVGSAFAVKADAYVKRGGMNRRQAGEDFYFLQNLVQQGAVGEITSTCVHPSARCSDRVPFGTGPILEKWMRGDEDLKMTYDLQAFADLKTFFDRRSLFFRISYSEFKLALEKLPEAVKSFLLSDLFWDDLDDLNKNCSTENAFENRFFQKFNAFKILKYLNFTSDNFYPKNNLAEQVKRLHQIWVEADKIR